MSKIESRLTVFFEDPFWVGVYERVEDRRLTVCKITFGAEPKDYQVWAFLLENWAGLRFSPPVSRDREEATRPNPKRMQRQIKKQLNVSGTGTKFQEALKLQQQEGKAARKQNSRREKDELAQRMFALRQQKRKEKHRGK